MLHFSSAANARDDIQRVFRKKRFYDTAMTRMFCRPFQHAPVIGVILALASTAAPVMGSDAKAAVSAEQPYHVSHWTSEDGLPENRITALAQTRDGYLWVGTLSGLARFDGVRFTVFNEVNTPSMLSQSINALAVENDGTLWIGTANGLLSYRDGRFTRFTADDHFPAVWRLIASRAGGVWMQVGGSGRDKIALWVGGR